MSANDDEYRLSRLTSTAFAASVAAAPVILLPLGSHEDHGPHLPMGDYGLATLLAGRIAARATALGTPAFVAPTLPFGVADYFGATAGGLALSAASFAGVLADLLGGLLRHGLRNIIILNGHGGNVPVIHQVTLGLRQSQGLVIPSFYLWKVARGLMESRLGAGQDARFGHGAEPLLSLTMALLPDAVRLDERSPPVQSRMLGLPVTGFGTVDFAGVPVDVPGEFDTVPRDATQAALPLASASLGAAVAADLVDVAARFVVHFAANAARAAGVSKSSSTLSVSSATSVTDSM